MKLEATKSLHSSIHGNKTFPAGRAATVEQNQVSAKHVCKSSLPSISLSLTLQTLQGKI